MSREASSISGSTLGSPETPLPGGHTNTHSSSSVDPPASPRADETEEQKQERLRHRQQQEMRDAEYRRQVFETLIPDEEV